jgi:hypothetical protein
MHLKAYAGELGFIQLILLSAILTATILRKDSNIGESFLACVPLKWS